MDWFKWFHQGEETQIRNIFAAYGRVMAKIGAFEQFMRLALGEHELRRNATRETRAGDTQAFSRRVLRMEFSGLAHQVADKFKFDPDLKNVMKDAKGFRNHLAHQFWVSHFSNLHTVRGRQIILRECALYEAQFERVAAVLVQATGVDVASYVAYVAGSGSEDVFRGWEDHLSAAEKVMADTGLPRNQVNRKGKP